MHKLFKEKNETFDFVKYFGIAFINYMLYIIYIYIVRKSKYKKVINILITSFE